METLALVVGATSVSMAIGVPLGIAAGHREWLYRFLQPLLDLMQTLPTFVYLIPALVLFGLGVAPGLIATVIFASAGADPAHPSRHHLGAQAAHRSRRGVRRHASGNFCGRSSCRRRCQPSWRASPSASCCRCRWWSSRRWSAPMGSASRWCGRSTRSTCRLGLEAGLAIVVLAIILDRVCRVEMGRARREAEMNAPAVSFKHVDILFGRQARAGLELLDKGATRNEILKNTGAVLGLRRCDARCGRGRDLRAHGLVGFGQVDAAAGGQRPQPADSRRGAGKGRRGHRRRGAMRSARRCGASACRGWPWCSSNSRCCRGAPSNRTSGSGSNCPALPEAERRERVGAAAQARRTRTVGPEICA